MIPCRSAVGLCLCVCLWLAPGADVIGQIVIPGADGSDGAFEPATSIEVDLSQAVTAAWDTPSPQPGKGVYDPEKWAVVFKYSSVNVPSGKTVTFKNHPSRAPVVWLVSGDVSIAGTVNVSGRTPTGAGWFAEPGPGGFRGGSRALAILPLTAGFGPGGGAGPYGHGSYSPYYSSPGIRPLIGGSGGSAYTYAGGAGGGAILIAAQGTIALSGTISSCGSYGSFQAGSGSGGAIRLVADVVTGNGSLAASGQNANGRIRVEANSVGLTSPGSPAFTWGPPRGIWPDAATPSVRVLQVGGQQVPADPRSDMYWPRQDVTVASAGPATVLIEARNVPLNWIVAVRAVNASVPITATATFQSGDESLSIWTASLALPANQVTAVQARALKP